MADQIRVLMGNKDVTIQVDQIVRIERTEHADTETSTIVDETGKSIRVDKTVDEMNELLGWDPQVIDCRPEPEGLTPPDGPAPGDAGSQAAESEATAGA